MTEPNTWTEPNGWRQSRSAEYGRDPKLRAGDRDREAVADMLRTQHGEGRLDTEELQQRIDSCYDAKTFGELEQVVVDLPRESRDQRLGWQFDRWRLRVITVAPLVVTLAALSALTGRHLIWLAVPLIFLTARLALTRHRAWWSSSLSRPRGWG